MNRKNGGAFNTAKRKKNDALQMLEHLAQLSMSASMYCEQTTFSML